MLHTHASKMTSIVNKFKGLNLHVSTIHGTKKRYFSLLKKQTLYLELAKNHLNQYRHQIPWFWKIGSMKVGLKTFIKSESEYFLYLGRFEPVKNPKRLINAWKDMNHKLIMVGEGALKGEMQNLIKDLNLSNQISIKI